MSETGIVQAPPRILGLQQRLQTIGKIRLGIKGSKGEPQKLTNGIRLTSPIKSVIEAAADKWGGQVKEWISDEGTRKEWEVIIPVRELPFLVSPVPVSQALESWDYQICRRRCDGRTERISGEPCLCVSENKVICKPTTRFSCILPDLPGLGQWVLESHGWTVATEFTQTADLLYEWVRNSRKPMKAILRIEERKKRKVINGKTQTIRYMVPTIFVPYTPNQLLSLPKKASVGPILTEKAESLSEDVIDGEVIENPERIKALGGHDLGSPRGKYFAIASQIGWPGHEEGTQKQINYRVWSEWLGRVVGPANGASKFSDEDWELLATKASNVLSETEDEPKEFEQYRLGGHASQLQFD